MKRLFAVWVMALLCALSVPACAQSGKACMQVRTDLLDAPHDQANVLMRYYIGTQVEVIREVDDTYVQVNVGKQGGSLMGYIEKSNLHFGEKAVREVRAESVYYTAAVGTRNTLYSYPDVLAPVIDAEFDVDYKLVLGAKDGWLHIEDGLGATGFIKAGEIVLTGPDCAYADFVYTEPASDELTYEDAIEYAKQYLLADGEMANGQDGVPLTQGILDSCTVKLDARYYYDTQDLIYDITFFYTDRTWEDGLPMLSAFVELWVEGTEVVRYGYGNG